MENMFELQVKSMLKWTLSKWKIEGQPVLGLKRLINSLRYWSGRLHSAKRDNNVILTLYQENVRAYPSLEKIAEALSKLNSEIQIVGFAKFKNKRFLSLTFNSLEEKDYVISNFLSIGNAKIAYLHWVDEVMADTIVIDWLSDQTDLVIVMEFIEQYLIIQECKRVHMCVAEGKSYTSGRIQITGTFKEGVSRESLPHLAIIDGLECLLLIDGRPLQCYICFTHGHKAVNCRKAYCAVCKCLRNKNHICVGEVADSSQLNSSDFIANAYPGQDQSDKNEEQNKLNLLQQNVNEKVNLFQDSKLMFTEPISHSSTRLEKIEEDLGATVWENRDWKVGSKVSSEGHVPKDWFREFASGTSTDSKNPFITEETKIGEPNFVLLDTSTSESNTDSEMDTQMPLDVSSEIKNYALSSKSLVDNCSQLKAFVIKNNVDSLKEIKKEEMRDSVANVKTSAQIQEQIERISQQILDGKKSFQQTGCKKKVKIKEEKTKKGGRQRKRK